MYINRSVVVSDSKKIFGLGSLQWYQSFDPPNLWKDQCMQRYNDILMGWRKKTSSETEAEMEGSGDDHEALDSTLVIAEFNKFQQSVNRTESTLVRYLDEYHETNRKGHAEISETLKKVDENLQIMNMNQSKLTAFLMEMAHKGKHPDT